MDISHIIDKILSDGITKKNYVIVFVLVMGAIFYLLGIDINYIKDITYINIFMLIGLFVYNLINDSLILNKIEDLILKKDDMTSTIELLERSIENCNYVKSKVDEINSNVKEHDKRLLNVSSDISNKPNLSTSKIIINSTLKDMFGNIFEECLNYTLLTNDTNNEVALDNLKNNINDIIKDKIRYIHSLLKNFEANETLTDNIKNKITNMINVIINDIQKNKKINEKLYIINCVLTETRKELKTDILDYLRKIQTNMFV